MRIGSLFSGYAGLDMAVAAHYDATVAWHVEFDKAPSKVLAHHWPDVPNYGDVTAVDWSQVEPVDIITGGFPCQDVSHAGLRRGVHQGTRSGLWFEMARAIDALRPWKVVIENVAGLLSADAACNVEPCPWCVGDEPAGHMRALGAVLADLAEMGFDAEWGSVRAADAGAPHGRLRVFVVAADAGSGQLPRAAIGVDGLPVAGERGGDPDLTLLPTPTASDARDGAHVRKMTLDAIERGASRGVNLNHLVEGGLPEGGAPLLPTPKASDGPNGGPGMRNGRGVADALPGVVTQLLPTPRATRGGSGTETSYALGGEIDYDERPQGVVAPGADFGPYTAAITRWSAVLGRQAPPPTEPGTNGRPRLSPRFVEFMMGLPDGWVCDVPGITRAAQLKMLGNGVVPQQALLALSLLDPS